MVTRLRVHVAEMGCTETDDEDFKSVCSGRGECGPNNSCICEIRYTGSNCLDYNRSYHAGESIIYALIGLAHRARVEHRASTRLHRTTN